MIELLETRNFRMLRSNSVALRPFQVLVGKNATGKSTFLGALQFVSDILRSGLRVAVESVAVSLDDLCFERDKPIALAIELSVPEPGPEEGLRLRYEIEVEIDPIAGLQIKSENLFAQPGPIPDLHSSRYSQLIEPIHALDLVGWVKVNLREFDVKFPPDLSALGLLATIMTDKNRILGLAWNSLRDKLRALTLNVTKMHNPSPPGAGTKLALDGSNLPHVVRAFEGRDPVLFDLWVRAVADAVEGLESISVREREEDRHLILEASFRGEHSRKVPSWMLSDGTLRLLALTLVSYAATEDDSDCYLVEEPENGLHPLAIEVAYNALARPVGGTQVLCATHSPIFLAQTRLDETLVFRRAKEGHAIVRRGPEIPELENWGRQSITDLFVTGVLS